MPRKNKQALIRDSSIIEDQLYPNVQLVPGSPGQIRLVLNYYSLKKDGSISSHYAIAREGPLRGIRIEPGEDTPNECFFSVWLSDSKKPGDLS